MFHIDPSRSSEVLKQFLGETFDGVLGYDCHSDLPWSGSFELRFKKRVRAPPFYPPSFGYRTNRLMHSQPERHWTVASLADRVGMPRSVFAARFKTLLSKPLQQHLLECRMRKACTLLVESEYGVKQVAARVGYATDAAFSSAFKRWSGTAPGTYRHVALDAPDRISHSLGRH